MSMESLGRGALLDLIAAAAARLAQGEPPAIIAAELAPVVEGRAAQDLAIPQWTTADGKARGVRIQAWSYAQRRKAEELATDRRPSSPTFGQISDWRRMLEEVRLGIVAPANLTIVIIESWGYDVVTSIHAAIERLGLIPPAILAAELASLVGAPPPPAPGARRPGPDAVGAVPVDLDGDAAAGAGLDGGADPDLEPGDAPA